MSELESAIEIIQSMSKWEKEFTLKMIRVWEKYKHDPEFVEVFNILIENDEG